LLRGRSGALHAKDSVRPSMGTMLSLSQRDRAVPVVPAITWRAEQLVFQEIVMAHAGVHIAAKAPNDAHSASQFWQEQQQQLPPSRHTMRSWPPRGTHLQRQHEHLNRRTEGPDLQEVQRRPVHVSRRPAGHTPQSEGAARPKADK